MATIYLDARDCFLVQRLRSSSGPSEKKTREIKQNARLATPHPNFLLAFRDIDKEKNNNPIPLAKHRPSPHGQFFHETVWSWAI